MVVLNKKAEFSPETTRVSSKEGDSNQSVVPHITASLMRQRLSLHRFLIHVSKGERAGDRFVIVSYEK